MPTEKNCLTPEQGKHMGQCWPAHHRQYKPGSITYMLQSTFALCSDTTNSPYSSFKLPSFPAPLHALCTVPFCTPGLFLF